MRNIFNLLAVAVPLVSAGVIDLDPTNFDSVVDGSKHALVEFFAPWCGHCKNLAPVYEELGSAYEALGKDVVIAKVDADAHQELGSRFGIQGFPTLKFFPKGSTEPVDYKGGRSLDDFVAYLKENTGVAPKMAPKISYVKELTDENFRSVVFNESAHVFVKFYAPWCGHCKSLAPVYENLAKLFSSESSVVIADVDADKYKSIGEEFKIEGFPTLKLFKKDAKSTPIECNGERTLLSLLSYLNSQLGTQRAKTGRLNNFAGLLEPLDQKVKDFMASVNKEDTIKSWKNELATLVADVDSPYKEFALNYYIHAAEKIAKKGIAYVRKESQRLTKLLEKDEDALGGKDKVDSIQMRKNILAVFAGDVKKYYNAKPGPGVVGTAGFADSVSKEEL